MVVDAAGDGVDPVAVRGRAGGAARRVLGAVPARHVVEDEDRQGLLPGRVQGGRAGFGLRLGRCLVAEPHGVRGGGHRGDRFRLAAPAGGTELPGLGVRRGVGGRDVEGQFGYGGLPVDRRQGGYGRGAGEQDGREGGGGQQGPYEVSVVHGSRRWCRVRGRVKPRYPPGANPQPARVAPVTALARPTSPADALGATPLSLAGV